MSDQKCDCYACAVGDLHTLHHPETEEEHKTSIFRDLDVDEEAKFRQWAHDNWKPGMSADPLWHPVVRDEWDQISKQLGGVLIKITVKPSV